MLILRRSINKLINKSNNVLSSRYTVSSLKLSTDSSREIIFESDVPQLTLPNLDICAAFFPKWQKFGDIEALECVSSGRTLSYNQLLSSSLRWSAKLRELEVRNTKRVSIVSPNSLEYAPIMFGTLAAGWSLNTVNNNYKPDELNHQLMNVKPSVLVLHKDVEHLADSDVVDQLQIKVVTIGNSNRGRPNLNDILFDEKGKKSQDWIQVSPEDEALVLASSGTTGPPKSLSTPHSSLTNNLISFLHPDFSLELKHDIILGNLPFYHAFGILMLNAALLQGSKVIVLNNFDPHKFGSVIRKNKIRTLAMVPTLLNFTISSDLVTKNDFSSVKSVICAGAPVLPSTVRAFLEKTSTGIVFQEAFGTTEAFFSHKQPLANIEIGSCGKLLPNTRAKIIDTETMKCLPAGQQGELLLKGPGLMSHYLNNDEATAQTIDREGWLHTGDVAVCSRQGYFKIVDRIKELIKVKGFQVSPSEIEDGLMKHASVRDACVIGIPDERVGEKVRAYIVATKDSVTSENEIIELVKRNFAPYKQLTGGVRFISEIPKGGSGKMLRKELKSLALQEERERVK